MASTILEQHQSIDYALLEVDALLDAVDRPPTEGLGPLIANLTALLEAHFEYEEGSYLFTGLVEDYPRFAYRIDSLKAEHVEMLAEIRSIASFLHELAADEVSLRFRALMARFGLHEAKEIDLLQDAHTDDIASVD